MSEGRYERHRDHYDLLSSNIPCGRSRQLDAPDHVPLYGATPHRQTEWMRMGGASAGWLATTLRYVAQELGQTLKREVRLWRGTEPRRRTRA